MADKVDFRCRGCGRRLPLLEIGSWALVICRYCKERTRVEAQPPSFRAKVVNK